MTEPERPRERIAAEGSHHRSATFAAERRLGDRDTDLRASEDRVGHGAFVDDVQRIGDQLPD